jgi:hypothetical protein
VRTKPANGAIVPPMYEGCVDRAWVRGVSVHGCRSDGKRAEACACSEVEKLRKLCDRHEGTRGVDLGCDEGNGRVGLDGGVP